MSEQVAGLILAGGAGARFGGETPKQFLDLAGEPMVQYALDAFDSCPEIGSVVLVAPDGMDGHLAGLRSSKLVSTTTGGDTRQASLGQGLICLPDEATRVVVHDAARPLIRPKLISAVLAGLSGGRDGIICAIGMQDAIKEVSSDNKVLRSRSRAGLFRVQTPQAFVRDVLEEALATADAEHFIGDDCADLLVRLEREVGVVPGDVWNFKVTEASDLALAEQVILSRRGSAKLSR